MCIAAQHALASDRSDPDLQRRRPRDKDPHSSGVLRNGRHTLPASINICRGNEPCLYCCLVNYCKFMIYVGRPPLQTARLVAFDVPGQ
ncbi:protein of unknown function [Burkholderia multivorans]